MGQVSVVVGLVKLHSGWSCGVVDDEGVRLTDHCTVRLRSGTVMGS